MLPQRDSRFPGTNFSLAIPCGLVPPAKCRWCHGGGVIPYSVLAAVVYFVECVPIFSLMHLSEVDLSSCFWSFTLISSGEDEESEIHSLPLHVGNTIWSNR